jgi:HD-like signal output (HDOD) protein
MGAVEKIIAEVGRGEVSFPTHADVAFRVRLALDDPDLHLAKAAQIVQAEPLLAARVVALANSVAFTRSGKPVTEVRTAVTRLGIKFVRALATAVVMRQMAGNSRSPVYRNLAERLWEHTTHVAALAHLLAMRFNRSLADQALFAGIVHEVGGFYLISRSDDYPDVFSGGPVLAADDEMAIGRAVLQALAVPDEVAAAIEALWQPSAAAMPPTTLGDLLCLADRLTPILSPLMAPGAEPRQIAADAETTALLAEVLEQSGEEMGSLTAALRY